MSVCSCKVLWGNCQLLLFIWQRVRPPDLASFLVKTFIEDSAFVHRCNLTSIHVGSKEPSGCLWFVDIQEHHALSNSEPLLFARAFVIRKIWYVYIHAVTYTVCIYPSIWIYIKFIHVYCIYVYAFQQSSSRRLLLKSRFSSSSSSKDQRFSKHVKAFDQFTVLVMPLDRRRCTADFLTKGARRARCLCTCSYFFWKFRSLSLNLRLKEGSGPLWGCQQVRASRDT